MHELSIAQAIADVVTRHAAGRRVSKVEVKVGHLRQVVPDSLDFAFELVSAGTPLEGAQLLIEEVPAAGHCRDCGAQSVMRDFPLCCARCGGLDMEVLAGEELLVAALELEELEAPEELKALGDLEELEELEEESLNEERMGHGSHV